MGKAKFLIGLFLLPSLANCAALGLKSVPWPTNVDIHDVDAVDFLRGAPAVDGELGQGLKTRNMLADGRLVGLAVSGGGARAAGFTLGVLTELQQLQFTDGSNALDRIDFISSNSGGSWAVAAYLADRSAHAGKPYRLEQRALDSLIPSFIRMSQGRVPCWSAAMREHLFQERTYRQVYGESNPQPLPPVFFNASLLPAHAPFVFNDAFLKYYDVDRMGACRGGWTPQVDGLADLPIGYAAAASGTVPGFYHAHAETGLCSGSLAEASFCHPQSERDRRSFLRLADGGLYDNLGYKTAYEIMLNKRQKGVPAAMILINSNTSSDFKTVTPSERKDSFLSTTASNGVFAVQDSTLERLYRPMFKSLDVDSPVLLDFYSAARFRRDQEGLLDGLGELAHYAAHRVSCYSDRRFVRPDRKKVKVPPPPVAESVADLVGKGGDCLSENFYRSGTLGKTTYKFDSDSFLVVWQLGRLAVRMNCAPIAAAVGGQAAPGHCPRQAADWEHKARPGAGRPGR